jgi:hypothetical protein
LGGGGGGHGEARTTDYLEEMGNAYIILALEEQMNKSIMEALA